VTFNGVEATSFKVVSDTSITAVAPPGSAGTARIIVRTPTGESAEATQVSYAHNATVTDVVPAAGTPNGGATVVIKGGDLTGATKVTFGSANATSITVLGSGTVRAVAPAGTGTVRVRVYTSANGTSPSVAAGSYTYMDGVAVTTIAPTIGPAPGGTAVTVRGAGFTAATNVLFGSTPATGVTVVSDAELTVTAPAGTGSVGITVKRGDTSSATVGTVAFTYMNAPTVTGLSRLSGSRDGGVPLTITGSGFVVGATTVTFGEQAAGVRVLSNAKLLVAVPPGVGSVDVRAATGGGVSPAVDAGRFRYVLPTQRYSYNGDGLRMAALGANRTSQFVWDLSSAIPQVLEDGTNAYIYGPEGTPIEHIDSDGAPVYYFHDALGSTRALVDASGSVVATFAYSTYGTLRTATGTATTPILFAGSYTDADTGLIYLVNRYYDPGTAQFLTVDPALDNSGAPYGYASGDPVNNIDPLGLWGWPSMSQLRKGAQLALGVLGVGLGVACVATGACELAAGIIGAAAVVSAGTDIILGCLPPQDGCGKASAMATLSAFAPGARVVVKAVSKFHGAPDVSRGLGMLDAQGSSVDTIVTLGTPADPPTRGPVAPSPNRQPSTAGMYVSQPVPSRPVQGIALQPARPTVVATFSAPAQIQRTYNPQQQAGSLPLGARIVGVTRVVNPRLVF
jgi:RHS repeat-associated protein